jgi:iron complex transport system ATP-binding protein
LEQVGLKGREETNYLHLSEGQKQLCILARTLVSDGSLLLLDEPESALDFRFRHNMLSLIREYVDTGNKSAVVALHDPMLALNFCDKLLLLSEGRTVGIISPKTDPLDESEKKLSMIYGKVSLQKCCNRSGKSVIVMLGEEQI